jgi:hypothetical protein
LSAPGEAFGYLRGLGVELGLLDHPGFGVPDLEVFAGADDDAGTVEAGVLDKVLGNADAAGRVDFLVGGASVEATAHAPGVEPEGAVGRDEVVREPVEGFGRMHPDAGVEALGKNYSISERRTEPGRNREAILRIERVFVKTAESQLLVPFYPAVWPRAGKSSDRGGEVGGASPPRSFGFNSIPTLSH